MIERNPRIIRFKWNKKTTQIASMLLFGLLAVCCLFMGKAYLTGEFQSVESFREFIGRFGVFGPAALTLFQMLQVIIPMLPGFLGCMAGSLMFGPVIGFLCNYIGISVGSILAFLLARRYGKPLLQDLFPEDKYRKWSDWIGRSKSYSLVLFLIMVLPVFPDDYFCFLTGVSEMRMRRFLWIILLGKPWCILGYTLGILLI